MRKVHITLVGKQKEPVLNVIDYTKPDLVYLIHSKDSVGNSNAIQREIGIKCILKELDPSDLTSIYLKINELKRELDAEDDISLNLTSGTKHWALAFYESFRVLRNAKIFLVDQNHIISDFATLSVDNVDFDMDQVFRLNGNPLNYYTSLSEYSDADFDVMHGVEEARRYNFREFLALAANLSEADQKKVQLQNSGLLESANHNRVVWSDQQVVLSLCNNRLGWSDFEFDSPFAKKIVFNSGWFELKVADILSHCNLLSDIRLNCTFPQLLGPEGKIKNEVDIIAKLNNRILFVECKTKLFNSTDIDKFRTVVSNYGGNASKALFITEAAMDNYQKEKCKESNITTFALNDYRGKSELEMEQDLFSLIEQISVTINY